MDFIFDSSLVLYLPLYRLDGASFISKDAYGHLCTVTGALWRPNGRYFDNVDDRIDCGSSPLLRMTTDTTISAWARTSDLSDNRGVVSKSNIAVEDRLALWFTLDANFVCYKESANDGGIALSGGIVIVDTWYFWTVRIGSAGFDLRINGTLIDGDADTNVLRDGTHKNLYLGLDHNNDNPLSGMIGEVWIYNRALSPIEIQHNYLATRGRYQ